MALKLAKETMQIIRTLSNQVRGQQLILPAIEFLANPPLVACAFQVARRPPP